VAGEGIKGKLEVSEVEKNISVLPFEIIADQTVDTSTTSEQFFNTYFKGLSPRKHTLKLNLGNWNSGSEFELD
jgi:hypothetical protein